MAAVSEFRRGWKPLVAAFVGSGCGVNSIPFYTHGVFVAAITAEYAWSRGAAQFAFSFVMMSAIVTAPLVGLLIDRIGTRRVALVSVAAFAIMFAALSLATSEIWTYYALWLVMAIAAAGTTPVTWTRTVNGWFERQRGLALGLTLASTGVVATFAPAIASALITDIGWRDAYRVLGLGIALVGLPVIYFLFHDRAAAKPEENSQPTLDKHAAGVALREGIRGYRFWALGISLLLVCAGIAGLITNLVPLLMDQKIERSAAASYAGIVGISVIGGRIVGGYLIDRLWAPAVAAIFFAVPTVSCYLLSAGAFDPSLIWLAALFIGLTAGVEVDILAYLTARYFGMKNYGAFYGGQFVFFAIGSGFAPAAFGVAFDRYGDYQIVLGAAAAMFVVSAALILTLGKYPKFQPQE
jgi:MFS family permease